MEFLINKSGSIVLVVRGWLPSNEGLSLCNKLQKELEWNTSKYMFDDKEVVQKRRTFFFSSEGAIYPGTTMIAQPWIPEIAAIRDRINKETGFGFNSCLINEYADGQASIGYHSDREALGVGNSVVTISLGGSRHFYIRNKKNKDDIVKTILYNGDACIMYGNTQNQYLHSIPKRAHAGYRISLTFRLIAT